VAETVDTTRGPSPTEGFQALGPIDLGDLESPAHMDTASEGAAETTPAITPAAVAEVQVATHTAASLAGPAGVSNGEEATPAGSEAVQSLDGPTAEPRPAAPVLKEAAPGLPKTVKATSAQTRRPLMAVGGVILVLAIASGVWLYARYRYPTLPDVQPRSVPEGVVVVPEKPASPSNQPEPADDDRVAWEAKLRDIDTLRQTLLAKKEEILRLQQNYQYGILELEEEAARLIRRGGFDSLPQALKNRQLELALQSIQRRQSYHDALAKPLHWIDLGSEELLYLRRRAFFDLQLKEIAEDIDITLHSADIDSALTKYQPTPERLSINNAVPVQLSLEVIWKRLAEQARHVGTSADDQRDLDIIAEVCSGSFGRVSELSILTLKGARCLAESGAMQLFLNRLGSMSSAAARKLCEWPGQWLCLNGVTRLSPELASQLFAWPGEWMSLNGLSEVPDEAAKYLAGWKGRQLELMGLRKSTGVKFLAQWEVSGGRLFVPDDIRREIEMFRRTGQLPAPAPNSGRW